MPASYIMVVVGILSGLILIPLSLRLIKPIASPYPAAYRTNRFIAGVVDLTVAVALYAMIAPNNSIGAATVSALYILCRDGFFEGQSLGKMCVGQVVIQIRSGNRGRITDSICRNIIFAVPGMNLVAVPFELTQIANDHQGIRIGDRLAGTQVIDGKDAKDLLTSVKGIMETFKEEIRERESERDDTPR